MFDEAEFDGDDFEELYEREEEVQYLLAENKIKDAYKVLLEVYPTDKDNPFLCLELAKISMHFNKIPEAKFFILKAKDVSGDAMTLALAAKIMMLAEDREHCEEYYNEFNDLLSGEHEEFRYDPMFTWDNGCVCIFLERYVEAIDLFEHYLDHSEKNLYHAISWHNLGVAYYNNQQYLKAIHAHELAIAIDETFVNPYVALGKIHQKHYDKADALRYYLDALKLDPENVNIKQLIQNLNDEIST